MLCCERDHRLIEGFKIINESREGFVRSYFPRIELKHVLWAKLKWDRENYDRDRLAVLYHRNLPRAVKLPSVLYESLWRQTRELHYVSQVEL